MLDTIGEQGQVYRFGGEEFTALLPETDETAAVDLAERLRNRIAEAPLAWRGRILGHITISIGVAASPQDGPVANLVSRADAGLIDAKSRGRNLAISASALNKGGSVAA